VNIFSAKGLAIVGAAVCAAALLAYVVFVDSFKQGYRARNWVTPSPPWALTNETVAMGLAEAALRVSGINADEYLGRFDSRNVYNSNRVTISWMAKPPKVRSYVVVVEQVGTNAVCTITRAK
jgi:hypothetical protein